MPRAGHSRWCPGQDSATCGVSATMPHDSAVLFLPHTSAEPLLPEGQGCVGICVSAWPVLVPAFSARHLLLWHKNFQIAGPSVPSLTSPLTVTFAPNSIQGVISK